jgi:hypothetical protein
MQDVPNETKRAGACEETRRVGQHPVLGQPPVSHQGLTIVEGRSPIKSASRVVSLAAPLLL